ncbi:Protein TRM32 [Ananas comosus]|uniref:Protein TRM32 n=1 Tax=Ananas comosus TaxID=4615 RepID=A0A199W5I2_ANACO|nr:Protein TRM32 [Ananas comosus]
MRRTEPSTSEEHCCPEGDGKSQMENGVNATSRSHRMALLRTLVSKRKFRDKDPKGKISRAPSRLLRTTSIHHLKCNNYVIPVESSSNYETSTTELSSHGTASTSSQSCLLEAPNMPSLEKLSEMCGSTNTIERMDHDQLDDFGKSSSIQEEGVIKEIGNTASLHHSKEFLDLLQLFNANRDLFLKILQNPSSLLPTEEIASTKFEMSHTEELLGKSNASHSLEPHNDQDKENDDILATDSTGTSNTKIIDPLYESKGSREGRTVSNHFRSIKRKIKDVIKENKEGLIRTSMDGILHKIPYGQKVTDLPNKDTTLRYKYGREGFPSPNSKNIPKRIRRSSSLNESLDRYSNLFESISSRDSKRHSERPKFMENKSPKALKRIFSLPDVESYFVSRDVQNEVSNNNEASDQCIPTQFESFDTLICTDGIMNSDGQVEQAAESTFSGMTNDSMEHSALISEKDKDLPINISDNVTIEESTDGPLHLDIRDIPANSTAISITSELFQDDGTYSAKHSVSGPELKSTKVHLNKLELLTESHRPREVNDGYSELIEEDFNKEDISEELDNINTVHIQVNEKDEADFQYVKSILKISGFSTSEILGDWYSPDQPVDPLHFEEAENSPREHDNYVDDDDSLLNHMLLFDLINEILLEIYDSSFVTFPQFSGFCSRIRPMPTGYQVLKEVWANISRYLSSQLQIDQAVENVVAQDFVRNDGWMNLRFDSEYVGLELEDLILDDLIDNVVFDLDDISLAKCCI